MATFQGLIDKPFYVGHIKNFDKMVTELSPFMNEIEIDQCISFMHTLKDTKNDTELNELVNLLKNQIHTYELLVFHSIILETTILSFM